MTTALYSGSFDPVTFGHLDIIRRAAGLFDRVVVAVGAHHSKSARFAPAERVDMLTEALAALPADLAARIDVATFDGLVVEAARRAGATAIVRGLRNGSDLDYETQMAGMNGAIAPEIDTIFLVASADVRHIASSLVKQVAALGGPLDALVPPHVARNLTLPPA